MNGISGQYGPQPMREGDCVPRGREEPIMWQVGIKDCLTSIRHLGCQSGRMNGVICYYQLN